VNEGRPDWTAVYYHRADEDGIGFDRTATGSNAVAQYFPPVSELFGNPAGCPEGLLLWFHHVAWDRLLPSGDTLWNELCRRYQRGVQGAERLTADWLRLEPYVDERRFQHVRALLERQISEARWWRDACIAYFRTFAKRPLPADVPEPEHALSHYLEIRPFPVPGVPQLP
jgi:alpha-glucuronidase